ncbi:MAG: phosphatidate cytidylyltransferase [Burkholderiales bacterium]|nr:phosphatidate cytidylyltransferase [Burkholderiales bacterium]
MNVVPSSVLVRRIITVAIILPLFLVALFWLPRPLWGATMLFVVVLACIEWGALTALAPRALVAFTLLVASACVAVAWLRAAGGALVLWAAIAFWLVVAPLWLRRTMPANSLALALAGAIVLVSAWYSLYLLQEAAGRLLALLGVVWTTDTAAYFVGRSFGRRKLAPSISPGKTWEGVFGAIAAVGVYYGLLWWLWAPAFLAGHRAADLILVAGMLALSIEGDLFESWVKRRAGVKDSGRMLPGHGGVLDRIDGLVAALPLAALGSVIASN